MGFAVNGAAVGIPLGALVGADVGAYVKPVVVGIFVGTAVGACVGALVLAAAVGAALGAEEGTWLGACVGAVEGIAVVGTDVGTAVGAEVGAFVGAAVVKAAVTAPPAATPAPPVHSMIEMCPRAGTFHTTDHVVPAAAQSAVEAEPNAVELPAVPGQSEAAIGVPMAIVPLNQHGKLDAAVTLPATDAPTPSVWLLPAVRMTTPRPAGSSAANSRAAPTGSCCAKGAILI